MKPSTSALTLLLWLPILPACAQSADVTTQATSVAKTGTSSKLRSSEDGWIDVSGFIDQSYGFLPLVFPITEPAVGYGAAVGLAFINKPKVEGQAGFGRPNITLVGGMATENGTRGGMVGDLRHWMDDRVQTIVGIFRASVNLNFYGIGEDNLLKDHPLSYNLAPTGGMARAKVRIGDTRAWVGLGYTMANTEVKFDAPEALPDQPGFERSSRIGGLSPSFSYDSRDTIFTPGRGTFIEAEAGVFRHALGSDTNFQRASIIAIQYLSLSPKVVLGLRGDASVSSGDAPFYVRPFISLRGAPAMRYQGEQMAQAEAELRWQFWKRFSLVGFAGTGAAWNESGQVGKKRSIVTGGLGFRYELARKYGLHAGVDFAVGPDGHAFYVQFGSAWSRP